MWPYKPKLKRISRTWKCLRCGAAGKAEAKDEANLYIRIKRHHRRKSPGCCLRIDPNQMEYGPIVDPSARLQVTTTRLSKFVISI